MQEVINQNCMKGPHACGSDFSIGSLQSAVGMPLGQTIDPKLLVIGKDHACAFLGHVVHAGAENIFTVANKRWHCYVQRRNTTKEPNAANGLPMSVAMLCRDSLRMACV